VDFGGPLPDVVYRCFEWEACEIEALDGTSLSPLVQGPWVTLFLLLLTSESNGFGIVCDSWASHVQQRNIDDDDDDGWWVNDRCR
jgi:hypothetical protein